MSRLDGYLAKSARLGGTALTDHAAAVARMVLRFRKRVGAVGIHDPVWIRAFWAAWLHDVGKMAAGFQRMLRDGGRWPQRHEVGSAPAAAWIVSPDSPEFAWIVAGILGHHQEPATLLQLYPVEAGSAAMWAPKLAREYDPEALRAFQQWTRSVSLRIWREETGEEPDWWPVDVDADVEWATGMVDCLKVYERWSAWITRAHADPEEVRRAFFVRGLVLLADHAASAGVQDWMVTSLVRHAPELEPYAFQRRVASVKASATVTAPTGSGKTEAALWWATQESGRGIVYLLPYQASVEAMSARLATWFGREAVGRVHGRILSTLYHEFLDQKYTAAEAARLARHVRDLVRLQEPHVLVTTPFQLLRLPFRPRGYEADWTSLYGRRVVVDEIHAYEPAILGSLLATLDWLQGRWGAEVLVMSATLPSWLYDLLPSPRLRENGPHDKVRHALELSPRPIEHENTIGEIIQAVEAGAHVLVVVNRVATTQELGRRLSQRVPTMVLHSRFTREDRARIETSMRDRLKVSDGFVLVATQVVEVSLDVDFDLLFTEIAPIEAVVQRMGRVNRYGRRPPARVVVHAVTDTAPYDAELVRQSWTVLGEQPGGDLLQLIDEVYRRAGLDARFRQDTERARHNFARNILSQLVPFSGRGDVQFDDAPVFATVEAIPSALVPLYRERFAVSPLDAADLYVPVPKSWATRQEDNWVIGRPYDHTLGVL